MRKAQVVIKVDLFGDASNERFEGWEPVCVYADANNVYEALASSYYEVLVALRENGHKLPSFGRREHIDTAELIARKKRELWLKEQKCKPRQKGRSEFVKETLDVLEKYGWHGKCGAPAWAWEDFREIPKEEYSDFTEIVKEMLPSNSPLYVKLKTDFDAGLSNVKQGVRYRYLCELIASIAYVTASGYYQTESEEK